MTMSKKAIKRVMGDIKELEESPLYNDGIYYHVNDDNIMNWKALIIGQEDTPYYGGFYFFDINFPNNYPFEPPKFKFKTYYAQPGKSAIRFNPNLYVEGKVCLSLLNTWSGEKWTPINTISSVFLSIQAMVLVKNPLHNEPGFEKDFSQRNIDYTNVITAANILGAIISPFNSIPIEFSMFNNIIKKYFLVNYEKIYVNHIDNLIKEKGDQSHEYFNTTYSNKIKINFKKCKEEFGLIHKRILIDDNILKFNLPEMPKIKHEEDTNNSLNLDETDINNMADKMEKMKLEQITNDELYSKLSKKLKAELVNFAKNNEIIILSKYTKKVIIDKIIDNIEKGIIVNYLN